MRLQAQIWLRRLKILGWVLFNAAQLISALIGIFTAAIGVAIVGGLIHMQWIIVPSLSFSAGIIVTLIVVIVRYLRTNPTRWLLRGYRWVKAEYLYHIDDADPKHHTQTIKIVLEALRPGVNHFENRYLWTGSGREEPIVVSPGHSLMGEPIPRGSWRYYYVYLGHELHVGQRVEVEIIQDLYDTNDRFEPFLAKTVIEPVDYLVLRVQVPRNRPPAEVSFTEERSAIPANDLIRRFEGRFDAVTGEMHWNIASPVFGHRYEIRWRW